MKKKIEKYDPEDPRFGWMLFAYDEYDIDDGLMIDPDEREKFVNEANPDMFNILSEYKDLKRKVRTLKARTTKLQNQNLDMKSDIEEWIFICDNLSTELEHCQDCYNVELKKSRETLWDKTKKLFSS